MVFILFNGYYTRMKLVFQDNPILSRTEERIVESHDISGHLKRLIDFTIESKKLLNVLAITSFFRRISPFSLSIMSVCPLLCLFEK